MIGDKICVAFVGVGGGCEVDTNTCGCWAMRDDVDVPELAVIDDKICVIVVGIAGGVVVYAHIYDCECRARYWCGY